MHHPKHQLLDLNASTIFSATVRCAEIVNLFLQSCWTECTIEYFDILVHLDIPWFVLYL